MGQTADLIVFACTNSFSLPFDAVKTITVVCRVVIIIKLNFAVTSLTI